MPLFIKKDLDTIMTETINKLQNTLLPGGQRIAMSAGSINRLLLAAVNSEIAEMYTQLEKTHLMAFLSTADEDGLKLIGELLSCRMQEGEDKEVYRERLANQVTALEAANELAIRMAILSVNGVQDVHLQKYTHGTGSFSGFVITEGAVVSEEVIANCYDALADVVAYGTKYTITGPELMPVEIGIKLILLNGSQAPESIKAAVLTKVREYINSKNIGEALIINEIIENVMSISKEIYDMEIFKFVIDSRAVLITNQTCRWNERFIEAAKKDAITIL